jgi:hypothetical protein
MIRVARLLLIVAVPMVALVAMSRSVQAAECLLHSLPWEYDCWGAARDVGGGTAASSSSSIPDPSDAFVDPIPVENSLFGRRVYARLADYTNVYAQPGRGAVLRNVGDGFIWVTVNRWFESEGAIWYEINPGEFVHEDDIRVVPASDFHGVAITRQPERPFGWVVQDVTPSRAPDGEPSASFKKLPRYTFVEVYNAVIGEEDWLWYDIGGGRWVRQTYFSIVDVNPRPGEVGPEDFWTEVDLYEQTFAAYEGDQMVYATLISSGLNRWPTREGLFQVWDRWEEYKMSGAEGKIDYYHIEDVPYIMYFDSLTGIALHGTYWHDRFSFKHSHGCVNMPILDAEWTYYWSEKADNDMWVWVHTSDPMNHLIFD